MDHVTRGGPLAGLKIVEFAGIGPGPFAAMILADLGAEVVRLARPGSPDPAPHDVLLRSRRILSADLKSAEGRETALALVGWADALIEGFRPGVMERLGLGPEPCHARNPRLVYGRMTGYGQDGPLAQAAGHDITYAALTGALSMIGTKERPIIPLNLVADFGGGGMLLVVGLLAALYESRHSGRGQVVDAAMVDGAALLTAMFHGFRADGRWNDEREANFLDGGAPFYNLYQCADGNWLAVGAIEPQFYAALRETCGLDDPVFDAQHDRTLWPEQRRRLEALFRTKTRDAWCALTAAADTCVAPVLTMAEAPAHPANAARRVYAQPGGVTQPNPAPRFGRTPPRPLTPPGVVEQDAGAFLERLGIVAPHVVREPAAGG